MFNAINSFSGTLKKESLHWKNQISNITYCNWYYDQTISKNLAGKTKNSKLKLKLISVSSKLAPKQWQGKVFFVKNE